MSISFGITVVILLSFGASIGINAQFSEMVASECAQIIIRALYETFHVVAALGGALSAMYLVGQVETARCGESSCVECASHKYLAVGGVVSGAELRTTSRSIDSAPPLEGGIVLGGAVLGMYLIVLLGLAVHGTLDRVKSAADMHFGVGGVLGGSPVLALVRRAAAAAVAAVGAAALGVRVVAAAAAHSTLGAPRASRAAAVRPLQSCAPPPPPPLTRTRRFRRVRCRLRRARPQLRGAHLDWQGVDRICAARLRPRHVFGERGAPPPPAAVARRIARQLQARTPSPPPPRRLQRRSCAPRIGAPPQTRRG